MLFEYLLHIYTHNFFEILIQFILFYNVIQILKQYNFYYILAYFLNFILFLGLYLILFDLDIVCIILWIVYGGVVIIFFVYSLIWFENIKHNKYITKYKFLFYFYFFFIFIFFLFINNITYLDVDFSIFDYTWTNYYELLVYDSDEELDNLGWGIIYYSTFFFLLVSYMLFLVCCTAIAIILNSKKIKYNYINLYYSFLVKNLNLINFNIFKYQNFYTQDYENINQTYSVTKNYKITHKFHKIKNFSRRV